MGHDVDVLDPFVSGVERCFANLPSMILIGCDHSSFPTLEFPDDSIVLDPWGIIPDQKNCDVIRYGRK